jgi:hypothetical protein
MVIFVHSVGKYIVTVNGIPVGEYHFNGGVYRYFLEETYMGIMTKEEARTYFELMYSE